MIAKSIRCTWESSWLMEILYVLLLINNTWVFQKRGFMNSSFTGFPSLHPPRRSWGRRLDVGQ